ncbi:gamma-glutamyl-gamma-aminobutyrate hydrolase family protein [Yinghuangia seranimata]|uniref:gamma-glutamyl-gamma-aminobutyrate hydrolase family protein n=1 Tax=Yinghuangia seranimata TaxID=408067 RepID=UPI00248BFA06|nr:gamma-glutamyl-gamma-aminobutyrate hydrolase family protein [Yinghuangia seranimata]MDI2132740.1 gamma-glutamyl-gamma-aminobutyrate hydrolase family protein [Yinghuangia seranimata]
MRPTGRPLVALPCRFAERTSALRYAAEVTARALAEAVYEAGGEPFMMHPAEPSSAPARLARCDALLLPGGGDLAPHTYGATDVHEEVYDVDDTQDAFDLAAARHALDAGLPTLAVCRGMQVVNVALGGTLTQDMPTHHRHLVHPVKLRPGSAVAAAVRTENPDVSCYHHQSVDRLGRGLTVTARAADHTVEAVELRDAKALFLAVQWHPEDLAGTDPANRGLFETLVEHARVRAADPV